MQSNLWQSLYFLRSFQTIFRKTCLGFGVQCTKVDNSPAFIRQVQKCASSQSHRLPNMSNTFKSISLSILFLSQLVSLSFGSFNVFPHCDYIDGTEAVRIKCFGEHYAGYSQCFTDFTNSESSDEHRSKVRRLQIVFGSACDNLDSSPLDGFFWNVRHLDYSLATTSTLYSNLRFRYLEVFDASKNELSALTPAIFNGQLSLREIDFSYNFISLIEAGTFDQNPELSTINLARNTLPTVDRDTFSSLAKLQQLDLRFNQIVAIDRDAFEKNAMLEVLRLQGNPLKRFDCHFVATLENLRSFDVSLNRADEMDLSCAKCKFLAAADADGSSQFQIHLQAIENDIHIGNVGVSELRHLNVADVNIRNVANVLDSLEPSLELLDLTSQYLGALTSNTFAKFQHLKYLTLSNTSFSVPTDTDPFQQLPELTALDLSNNNLAAMDFSVLSLTLSRLIELNVANCRIGNVLPLLELLKPALESLNLASNSLQSINARTFQRFINLKLLNLSHTHLQQFDFTTFFHQNQLIVLDLSHNRWSEVDFSLFVRKLTNVETLNLEGNHLQTVNGLTPAIFPQLNTLGLSKNQFSCEYLAKLLMAWPNLNLVHNPTKETHIDGIDCILNTSNDENLI